MVNLHIIGAQKCGTTALAHFLHQHPDIYVLDGKEAHVFDNPQFLRSKTKMAYAKEAFTKRMKHYAEQAYICDATPITWYQPRFLKHCYNYNPQAKFIVLLRCPVERAISHFTMSAAKKLETNNMLSAFLQENTRLKEHEGNWRLNSPLRHQSYLHKGLYCGQLKNLYSTVPQEQVLVVYQKDLIQAHQPTLNKVFTFLKLPSKNIDAEVIFANKARAPQFNERLAKLYAKLYFYWHGESKEAWDKIIPARLE